MKLIRGDKIEFIPASHEDPKNPGVLKRVLASKSDLLRGQVQMVNWSRLPAGSSFQSHYHEDMQEVFILLGGPVTMKIASDPSTAEQIKLDAGDAVLIEPKEIHQMTNVSGNDIDYIVFGISTEAGGQTVVVEEL